MTAEDRQGRVGYAGSQGELAARTAVLAGRLLLENGGETTRTEDTMRRICQAAGAQVTDSYATPGMLMVSFTWQGQMIHNMKRTTPGGTDLEKIQAVNGVSRQICQGTMTMLEGYRRLQRIALSGPVPLMRRMMGAALAGCGFGLVFCQNVPEALAAGALALAASGAAACLSRFSESFRVFAVSGLITLAARLCLPAGLRPDPVILSAQMILVPGMMFTTALRDFAAGDTLSGLSRLACALLTAVVTALGNIAALALTGGIG
ncbi:threonine/serine exporter family protein [uncultured Faecalibaculum sp.]|uniref:threonine/serine exporter family protein n=1 Tax=uncultured Faecalibaculum sp. TaxID=1729681 RepID=UPI0025FBC788|nr:threonine/serine exporter family protein [uncultured Faecalibaculum sp.]